MKNKYNYEDDLYEEEDYYDEDDGYYNDDYKQEYTDQSKAKKPSQPTKQNNTKPQQQKPKEEVKPKSSPVVTTITQKKKEKELTIDEMNKMKYPPINYGITTDQSDKPTLSLVIIGHVDSGKSTLMGHLLYKLGEISDRTIQSYSKNFKKTGNKNFHFAWATDEGTDERERGVTVDIAYKTFQTKTKSVSAMDAPGHRDFIPNMITGTSAADAAILVIDSGKGSFNAGFFANGQTKEHAILAKTLGVKQIIVVINKLEMWEWSQERFDYIESQVKGFLLTIDFQEKDLFFIPISGLQGDNLLEKSQDSKGSWYTGPTLVDLIDQLEAPIRALDTPVRFIINDATTSSVNNLQGRVIFGKLECGVITDKTEYEIVPLGIRTKVRTMAINKVKVDKLIAGQTGEILLTLDKNSTDEIIQGHILSSIDYLIPCLTSFQAQIKTLDIKAPITIGQKMFVHLQGQKVQVTIKKIPKIFNHDISEAKNNTIFIPKNFYGIVNLECDLKICIELYSNIKQLGRIALRGEGETLAVGIVLQFL